MSGKRKAVSVHLSDELIRLFKVKKLVFIEEKWKFTLAIIPVIWYNKYS
nr:MAG TPA: hypothetical protein [Caudoviricetes sp.]